MVLFKLDDCIKKNLNEFIFVSLCKKLNSQWITNLNIRADTLNLTE